MADVLDEVDFALAAYREEGVWQVQELAHDVLSDVDALSHALRRFPGDGGAVGLVAVDEDFFVIARVAGHTTRLLLSDITAATDWPIALAVVEHLDLPVPDDEDEPEPAGDLAIVADLGLGPMDLGALIDDDELYPDEMLGDIASRLGFGPLYDDMVGVAAP